MPKINGIDAARRIRELLPTTKIILLSMHMPEVIAEAQASSGADAFVSKISVANELVETINRLFGDH